MKQSALITIFILLITSIPVPLSNSEEIKLQKDHRIEGNKIIVDDYQKEFTVFPHTSSGDKDEWIYLDAISKAYDGKSHFYIGINSTYDKSLFNPIEIQWFKESLGRWYKVGDFVQTDINVHGLNYWILYDSFSFNMNDKYYFRYRIEANPIYSENDVEVNYIVGFMESALVNIGWFNSLYENKSKFWIDPWINNDYQYRMKLTFDSTNVNASLTNFPVTVFLTAARFNFSRCQSDGDDIRFYDADNTTALDYDVEDWNADSEEAFIHVEVPQIDANSTTDHIWLYYSNPSATDGSDTEGTWNSDYEAVYHFKWDEAAAATYYDSTNNNNDLTPYNTPTNDTCSIDGCKAFVSGSSEYALASDSNSLDITGGITITVYGNYTTATGSAHFLGKRDAVATEENYGIRTSAGNDELIFEMSNAGSWHIWLTNAANLASGNVYVIQTTYDESEPDIYVDGSLEAGACSLGTCNVALQSDNNKFGINRAGDHAASYQNFKYDEVRLMSVAKDANWTYAEYLSLTDNLITYGSEEEKPFQISFQLSGITGNYLVALINNVQLSIGDFPYNLTADEITYEFYSPIYNTSQRAYVWTTTNSSSGDQADSFAATSDLTIVTTYTVSGGPLVYGVMAVIVLGVLIAVYWGLQGGGKRR